MVKISNKIAVGGRIRATSPLGLWKFAQLIGSSVKIKSLSVSSGPFGFSSDSLHTISDIGFRVNRFGKSFTVIRLADIPEREFTWKDLEIVGLKFCTYCPAICGTFCSDGSISGYNTTSTAANGNGNGIDTSSMRDKLKELLIRDDLINEDGDTLD